MKRIIAVALCALTLFLFGCGNTSALSLSVDTRYNGARIITAQTQFYLGDDGVLWGGHRLVSESFTPAQLELLPEETKQAIAEGYYDGEHRSIGKLAENIEAIVYRCVIDADSKAFGWNVSSALPDQDPFRIVSDIAQNVITGYVDGAKLMLLLESGELLLLESETGAGTYGITGLKPFPTQSDAKVYVVAENVVSVGKNSYLTKNGDVYFRCINNGHGTRGNGKYNEMTLDE